ncbi:MAG: aldehyde dehydrogenase family protein [Pseudomonadota bacterium]
MAKAANSFKVISPVDGRVYVERPFASSADIETALAQAEASRMLWRKLPVPQRSAVVVAFSEAMSQRADALAEALTWQMGRPLSQADETPRLAAVTRHAAERVEEALAPRVFPSEHLDGRNIARLAQPAPTGLHLSICAWNYPTAMLGSLVCAPLLAGNVVVLKHSPQTPVIAELAEEAWRNAGGPLGVFQSLHLAHADAEALIRAGRFDAINFIGSVRSGRHIAMLAAESLTDVKLELGGKDPTYIRGDADLDLLVPQIAEGCYSNSGQSCCSVERIYVDASIHDRLVDRLQAETANWTLGHPVDEEPSIGPLWRAQAADYVREQIASAEAQGAQRLLGDARFALDRPGSAYVAPEVLTRVTSDMTIMRDELFGPVACVQSVASDAEAIRLMNDSPYGLTASVWTEDTELGLDLLDQLDAGTVYLNRCDHADLYLPWGGVKRSGIGRNNGVAGLQSATALKAFHINTAASES